MSVTWPDHVDEIFGADLTAALAYVTPAGGAVVMAVAPIGMRDRERGTVSFTTSLGFAKKLDRIRSEPRVALAYHAREHGTSGRPEYVLVQGRAEPVEEPDESEREQVRTRAALPRPGHTETGFVAPPNKTLLLLFNGLQAKQGVRKARREGKLPAKR